MKIPAQYAIFLIFVAIFFSGCSAIAKKDAATPTTSNSGLVNSLMQNLGVSNEQATGGAGAILGYAKNKLSPEDFSTVNKSLPEADSLIKAAPKEDTSKLAGMTSALSGGSDSAAGLGALAGSFGKLGLSPDMVGQFVPVVLQYANSKGGSTVSNLLGSVLK